MQTLQSVNAGNVSLAAVVNGFLVDCGFILLIFFFFANNFLFAINIRAIQF